MDSVINNIKFQCRVCLKPDTYNLHNSYFKIISIYMCLYMHRYKWWWLSLPNNVWRLIVFAPFLIIIIIILLLLLLLLSFFPWHMNLSTADLRNYWTEFHETWWSYRYIFLVGPNVFSFVVKGSTSYLEGFKGGGGYYRILWESWNFVH